MAVVEDNSTAIVSVDGGAGTVRIAGDCVTFVSDGGRGLRTLAWRSDFATWDDLLGQVIFDLPWEEPVRISDGDRLDIGGARPSAERWLQEPNPDCPVDTFVVHEIEPIR